MKHDHVMKQRAVVLIALVLVSAIMAAASCGGDDAAATGPDAEASTAPRDAAVDDGVGIPRDAQIIDVLLTANTALIEQSAKAQRKATIEAVKGFAAVIETDHAASNERLQSLASQRGVVPETNPASEAFRAEAAGSARKLEPLSGSAFDKAYMDAQIALHEKLLALIDDVVSPAVSDRQLGALVTDLRTKVATHRLQAERIRGALEPGTSRPDGSATDEVVDAGPT